MKSFFSKIIYHILWLILLPSLAHSQDLTQVIRGQVSDRATQRPLEGVHVSVYETQPAKGTITDTQGNFRFEKVPLGMFTIHFSRMGYESYTIDHIRVISGRELIVNVELDEKPLNIDEVVVLFARDRSRPNNRMTSVSTITFNADDTRRFAGSLNDPSRMAGNFAGVAVSNDTRNDIIIRGNSPMGLLWRIEGVDIPNPNHFAALGTTGGPVSVLNNNLIDKSDFFTGAFPAEYGNALAGVFDIRLRPGNSQRREHLGQLGFNGLEVGAEGPFSKYYNGSYLFNYRYSMLGALKALGVDFGTGVGVPEFQDMSFKLNLPTSNMGHFTLFGMGGLSHIELLRDPENGADDFTVRGFDTRFGSRIGVAGFSHRYFIQENTFTDLQVAVSSSGQKIRQDSIGADSNRLLHYGDDSSEHKYTVTASVNQKVGTSNVWKAGIIFSTIGFNYADSVLNQTQTFRTLRDFKGNASMIQLFLQWQRRFGKNLVINPGIHAQTFSLNNQWAIEPRVGVKWQFRPDQWLNGGIGFHSQRQPMAIYYYQSQPNQNNNSYRLTNLNLGFSKSFHAIIGYERHLFESVNISTEVYYQHLYDIPIRRGNSQFSMLNAGANFGIPSVDSLINEGTGRNFGVELKIQKHFSDQYYFLVTTSVFESRYTGGDEVERNTAFNGNYVVNVLGGKEFNLRQRTQLSFDIRTVSAGGRRFTPIDLDASRELGQEVLQNELAWSKRYPGYFRLDFRVSLRMNHRRATQEWFVDFQNLTNHKNIFRTEYNHQTQNISTIYQLRFFPMVNFRLLF